MLSTSRLTIEPLREYHADELYEGFLFYNRQRRHSTINYVAPLAFEASTSA